MVTRGAHSAPEPWTVTRDALVDATRREKTAVLAELARRGLDAPVLGRDGKQTDIAEDASSYSCTVPVGLLLVEATPLEITAGREHARGQVDYYETETGELRFTLTTTEFPATFDESVLAFNPSFLLEQLALALEELPFPTSNVQLAAAFLAGEGRVEDGEIPAMYGSSASTLNPSQVAAVQRALGSEVTFVWGPPGTGKTSTLAHLIAACVARGERVAVLAPTNVATDTLGRALLGDTVGASLAVAAVAEAAARGSIVRLGDASAWSRSARADLDAVVEKWLQTNAPEVIADVSKAWQRLEKQSRRRSPTARARMRDLSRRPSDHTDLIARMDAGERATLNDARVILTTLSTFYLSANAITRPFDVLIVDEASMASPAAVFFAATRATKRVVAGGDFLQLPPVVVGRDPRIYRYLGRSVFAMAGMDKPELELPRRPMLQLQYRMRPAIAAVVGGLFYASRLDDAPIVRSRDVVRGVGSTLRLLDTSAADVLSVKTEHGSRVNEVHAQLVVLLARKAIDDGCESIGIVAPYAAQVRLIRELLREHELDADRRIAIGTVHRFQGGERDLMLFDTVDAPPMPSHFLNDRHSAAALPLVNVAISRARESLVVVAFADHLTRTLGRDTTLSKLIAHMRAYAQVIRPEDVGTPSATPQSSLFNRWVRISGLPRFVVKHEGDTVFVTDPTGGPHMRQLVEDIEAVKEHRSWAPFKIRA